VPARLAIVGAGAFGREHAKALEKITEARLVAVVSEQPLETSLSAIFGGAEQISFDTMLADADIDGVILCTPTPLHAQQALACISSGKHVLIEIPLADNIVDAEEVLCAAHGSKCVVMVGHVRRYNLSHAYLHSRFQAGSLDLHHLVVRTHFLRRQNLNAQGEHRSWTDHLLWHHAMHTIDLFRYQTGEEIESFHALQGPIDAILGIALDMSIQLRTVTGKLCTLSLSFNDDGPIGSFFRYICNEGTFEARYDELFDGYGSIIAMQPEMVGSSGLERQDRAFANAIRNGIPPLTSIEQSIPGYRLINQIQQALDTQMIG